MIKKRGETTRENLKKLNIPIKEGIMYQSSDLCGSDKPIFDYTKEINKNKYKEFIKQKSLVRVKIVNAEPEIKPKHRTDSEQNVKFDDSLLHKIHREASKNELNGRKNDSLFGSDSNINFRLKEIKKI